ncbi:MAG: 1-acyl-sn-glycerol-3-phosphate acyltransferase [Muribaculaceae bacterium]|nr:1-acyl-sn-glycerol-3-phosphate acyltransferase [Muribaculaceae bacterium]MDE6027894.1 1-acyl-sn-glycerol-3-phosphate acyltransferase [Muribaculaceae bacterium]
MLKIDLKEIVKARGMKVPGPVVSLIEKIIHQDELNDILRVSDPKEGADFSDSVYSYLNLTLDVKGWENVPKEGRFVFASNHPLGGLDGIGLVKVLGRKYGDENIRVLVNDMLMNVEPLRKVFLPINKFGAQGREATKAINEAYASDKQIVMFPAGLVSRLHPDGEIRDLDWQKSFVAKAIESGRKIIPIRFEGLNRRRFYRLAKWRQKLGIKFNIEQIFLPAEVCASRGKNFALTFLPPVDPADLKAEGKSLPQIAGLIRKSLYS